METPRVSICIPVRNMQRTIKQTVESALKQTYQSFEVLVVDNRSTDRTMDILSSLQDTRLHVVQNEQDLGVYGNHNRCVELARGEFVKFLHADDILHPACLEEMMKPFDGGESDTLGCVACGAIELNLLDKEFRKTPVPPCTIRIHGGQFLGAVPRVGNFVGTPSMTLLRKSAVVKEGRFDPARRHGGDLDCWLRLSRHYDFAVVPHHLVSLRSDPPSADPAKRYDWTAVLLQLDLHYKWFRATLGGDPFWRSELGIWMCRESILYLFAYTKEACLGRTEPFRRLCKALSGYKLFPQLFVQVLIWGPKVLIARFFPSSVDTYAKVRDFFTALASEQAGRINNI